MYSTDWFNNINRSGILPSLTEKRSVKENKKWQMAVMDSFEHIAIEQFQENLPFVDYYRMVDGQLSFQELSEVVPHLKGIQDLLDGVGVPTFLKHYDILGVIVNALVGKYLDLQDKFHVVDVSEIAENEFMRQKNSEIEKYLQDVIKNEIELHMASAGFDPNGKQFNSPEEQQAFLQQLEQFKQQYTPQSTNNDSQKGFKTLGVQWGEATMEKDKEVFDMPRLEKEEFKNFLLTGRPFREYKLGYKRYYPKTWSPVNTFFSKEIDVPLLQRRKYAGRLHFYLPHEIIREYGHEIPTDIQKKLLGGNKNWETYLGGGVAEGTIHNAISNNFNKQVQVPFAGYFDYNFMLNLQDELQSPMGVETRINPDGSQSVHDRFLPRLYQDPVGRYTSMARLLRNDFLHSPELCQVTEVYFIAYDLVGYLTYEDEYGQQVTAEVTEDILKDFLKENNIKQTYKEKLVDINTFRDFEPNTLMWFYQENTYEGVKIQSPNLTEPIYVYCRPMEHQIQGDTPYQRLLPVAGMITKAPAAKIAPFQAQYNLCMNQIWNMLEKEIGMFFLMDVALIPSEYQGYGDSEDAFYHLRNIAKNVGFMPVATSQDGQKTPTTFNQFSVYDINYGNQIASRVRLAEFYQQKAWEVIGVTPQMVGQPTKQETAEGVRVSQEVSYAQVSELFEDFAFYKKHAWDLHLAVAQYAQGNEKDLSVQYTKSDGSMAYLKLQDENFPLRRMGVLPSEDRKKRKELEQLKQYLLSNNTMAGDTIEFAKLMSSDTMREALNIAMIERKARQQQEQVAHERNMQLEDKRRETLESIENRKDNREFRLQQMKDETDIHVATINAAGRAADKQSDTQGQQYISEVSQEAAKDIALERKVENDASKLRLEEKKHEDAMQAKFQEFSLKAKELSEKIETRKSNERIAAMNKN